VKLEIWSPLPPTPSGVAAHVAEVLRRLRGRVAVAAVAERPADVDAAALGGVELLSPDRSDPKALRLYELGNSRYHGFVYREALRRPGVLRLHEWSLHSLVLWETHHGGDDDAYARLMAETYGAVGRVVAREVLGGRRTPVLESLYPLSEHLVALCRAVAATTALTCSRAAAVRPGIRAVHLPLHALPPVAPMPSRAEARAELALPAAAFVVTAPGLVNPLKGLDVSLRVAGRLRRRGVPLHFVVAGENEPQLPLASWAREAGLDGAFHLTGWLSLADFARHIAAADVVLALRFPTLGEASAVLLRAMAVGRPAIVTAGTPADVEFPEGVVVPVDPGRYAEAELEAQLEMLFRRPDIAERIGQRARRHVKRHHDPDDLAARLVRFLETVATRDGP
jgi:glycosyltransferase involved in cell wall biosynthesis